MQEVKFKKLPKHIGFIIDGTGRWAKRRGLTRSMGHKAGFNTLKKIIKTTFYELGIKYFLIEPIGTNIQSFSGNITLSDTSNVAVTKSYKSASGTYTSYDLTINSNTHLLSETGLGSSSKKEIILIVMNTSLPVANQNNYDAHITVSVNGSLY